MLRPHTMIAGTTTVGVRVGIDQVRTHEKGHSKTLEVDRLYNSGILSDDDMATLAECVGEVAAKTLTTAAVHRWLLSKDGVTISCNAVASWLERNA